jgi:hypothetical protein
MLAQTAAGYAESLALILGGLFVLIPVLYLLATWAPGREGDERRHEKAITKELRWFGATEQRRIREAGHAARIECKRLADSRSKARYRDRPGNWLRRRVSPSTVIVHGRRITDANGDDIYVLWIDHYQLAHRSLEQLLEDAETVIEHRLDRTRVPATKSERYYQDMTEGYVDIEDFQKRLQGDCYTRIESNMKKNGRLDEDDLRERLVYDDGFRYPPEVFNQKLRQRIGNDIRRIPESGELVWERFT